MDEWVLNPTAHTALDEILPCVDNATAMETLAQSKNVTHSLVELVDNFISSVTNGNTFPYNQSGPLVPALCNPFNSDYTLRQCAAGEFALENATEVRAIENNDMKQYKFIHVGLVEMSMSIACLYQL